MNRLAPPLLGLGTWLVMLSSSASAQQHRPDELDRLAIFDDSLFIKPTDVKRRLQRREGERRLAFEKHEGDFNLQ